MSGIDHTTLTLSACINAALHQRLTEDARVHLLGCDILDPYGGAFKVTQGLSSAFPGRVHASSVSEAGLIGAASGMALAGLLPIVEIMFADFLTLGFDQLLNHAAKFPAMYGGGEQCPLLIRTPTGAGRGYGATHSQAIEKYFLGIPSLSVAVANLYTPPLDLIRVLQHGKYPAILFEPKRLYPQPMRDEFYHHRQGVLRQEFTIDGLPAYVLSLADPGRCEFAIVSYGGTASLLEQVILELAIEEELFCRLICVTGLTAQSLDQLWTALAGVRRVVFVEESTSGWGWGSEWAYQASRGLHDSLERAPMCIANTAVVVPAGIRGEEMALLGASQFTELLKREFA